MENADKDQLHCGQFGDDSASVDQRLETAFAGITELAAHVCGMPAALLAIIDAEHPQVLSAIGLDAAMASFAAGFCAPSIRVRQTIAIDDMAQHPAPDNHFSLLHRAGLRSLAAMPVDGGASANAVLAVLDRVPRCLDPAQWRALELLCAQAGTQLALHQRHTHLQRLGGELERKAQDAQWQVEHLQAAQRIADIGSWDYFHEQDLLICSAQVYRIFGLAQVRPHETLDDFLASVHRDDRAQVAAQIAAALRERAPLDMQHRIVQPGGVVRHVAQRARFRTAPNGECIFSGTVQDSTDQYYAQEKLRLLHACVERLNDVVMITEAAPIDEPGPRIVFINPAFERLTGYRPAEVLGRSPRFMQGPLTSSAERARIRHALESGTSITTEIINYTKSGKPFWSEFSVAPVEGGDGRPSHFVSIQRNITQRKQAEAEIERLAFYDALTGLPNRRLLLDRLQHAVDMTCRTRQAGALLYLDLDNFKTLNDTLGHEQGDLLLQQVARRLEQCVRKSSTVARLGGDEFVILLEELSDDLDQAAACAEAVAEKVLAAFSQPFAIAPGGHSGSTSIGITLFDPCNSRIDTLLRRADLAMYHAKTAGPGHARFFDPDMQSKINARARLEKELRQALQESQFLLHYQPQIDDHGNLTGAEALVRWRHPERGLVFPGHFIALAEETGLILQIGEWILRTVCAQLRDWRTQSRLPIPIVSVNVSVREFRHPEFVRRTLAIVKEAGIEPSGLKFELTEGMLIENVDDVVHKMAQLKDYGIGFSLDDFGTGYSSLSYLKRLPIDQLKIDQSFVRDVLDDYHDAAIAKTIVALGQTLGLDVIAEGVETEGQREFLANSGCHLYQGYLFSKPVPAEQL